VKNRFSVYSDENDESENRWDTDALVAQNRTTINSN
jgi:hypothetical protein